MAGDWLKAIISHHFYEDNLNFFYNCQRHLQEVTYVVFLCLWKKLDFVLCGLNGFVFSGNSQIQSSFCI